MAAWLIKRTCKDCGSPFAITASARTLEVARGLSEPERCPDCQHRRAGEIRSRGAIFQEPPIERDPAKRCWGRYGLGYLRRKSQPPIEVEFPGVDHHLPYLHHVNAAAVHARLERGELTEQDLEVAKRFAAIAPAAEALVRNLEDPNGTRVSVLVGPTGTGKSTWVPYRLLRSRVGQESRICITQPRLITLRRTGGEPDDSTTPGFIARHLLRMPGAIGPGHEIGYQHRGVYDQQNRYTKLLFVTDGTLVRWLETGRVGEFGVVFVDEAHEQSANMELIFALLKYQLALYPHLRVVIASATADIAKFRDYFGDGDPEAVFLAQPPDAHATPFEVRDHRLEDWAAGLSRVLELGNLTDPAQRARALPGAIADAVAALAARDRSGDILVFLPTVPLLKATKKALEDAVHAGEPQPQVLLCHAEMEPAERRALRASESRSQRDGRAGGRGRSRRIILATNFAETSVTFSNLAHVIDPGMSLEVAWDPTTCSSSYTVTWHSRAGCRQRLGRLGRVRPGDYWRLFTLQDYERFPEHTPPEIAKRPLDSFLMSAQAAGIDDLGRFRWLNRPAPSSDATGEAELQRAVAALRRRGIIDEDGDITRRGLQLGSTQVSRVELAEAIHEADIYGCAFEVSAFLAFTEQKGTLFTKTDAGLVAYARWRNGCNDDLEFYLRISYNWQASRERLASGAANAGEAAKRLQAWAEGEGFRFDSLVRIDDARKKYLSQFRRTTPTDEPDDRAPDLKRLVRARIVLAKALPEWVYLRSDFGESQEVTFVPLSEECTCREALSPDHESACLAAPDLDAFLCVERTRVGQGGLLKGRHLVRIDPAWLPRLEGATPLGVALLMQEAIARHAHRAGEVERLIRSAPPEVDTATWAKTRAIRAFRAIRLMPAAGEGPRGLLAIDLETGCPAILEQPLSRILPGTVFRAATTEVSSTGPLLDQDPVYASYVNRLVRRARVTNVRESDAGELRQGVHVELEPGVTAYLRRFQVHVEFLGEFDELVPGDNLSCLVSERSPRGGLIAVTERVALYRQHELNVGDHCDGLVQGFYERDGQRIAAFVELVPGRVGIISRRVLPSSVDLASWELGDPVDVVITATPEGKRPLLMTREVHEARTREYQVGECFDGVVTRVHRSDQGLDYAIVEIAPGRTGLLRFRLPYVAADEMSLGENLEPGDRLEVGILAIGEGHRLLLGTKRVVSWREMVFDVGENHATIAQILYSRKRPDVPHAVLLELVPGHIAYMRLTPPGTPRYHLLEEYLELGQTIPIMISEAPPDRGVGLSITRFEEGSPFRVMYGYGAGSLTAQYVRVGLPAFCLYRADLPISWMETGYIYRATVVSVAPGQGALLKVVPVSREVNVNAFDGLGMGAYLNAVDVGRTVLGAMKTGDRIPVEMPGKGRLLARVTTFHYPEDGEKEEGPQSAAIWVEEALAHGSSDRTAHPLPDLGRTPEPRRTWSAHVRPSPSAVTLSLGRRRRARISAATIGRRVLSTLDPGEQIEVVQQALDVEHPRGFGFPQLVSIVRPANPEQTLKRLADAPVRIEPSGVKRHNPIAVRAVLAACYIALLTTAALYTFVPSFRSELRTLRGRFYPGPDVVIAVPKTPVPAPDLSHVPRVATVPGKVTEASPPPTGLGAVPSSSPSVEPGSQDSTADGTEAAAVLESLAKLHTKPPIEYAPLGSPSVLKGLALPSQERQVAGPKPSLIQLRDRLYFPGSPLRVALLGTGDVSLHPGFANVHSFFAVRHRGTIITIRGVDKETADIEEWEDTLQKRLRTLRVQFRTSQGIAAISPGCRKLALLQTSLGIWDYLNVANGSMKLLDLDTFTLFAYSTTYRNNALRIDSKGMYFEDRTPAWPGEWPLDHDRNGGYLLGPARIMFVSDSGDVVFTIQDPAKVRTQEREQGGHKYPTIIAWGDRPGDDYHSYKALIGSMLQLTEIMHWTTVMDPSDPSKLNFILLAGPLPGRATDELTHLDLTGINGREFPLFRGYQERNFGGRLEPIKISALAAKRDGTAAALATGKSLWLTFISPSNFRTIAIQAEDVIDEITFLDGNYALALVLRNGKVLVWKRLPGL